MSMTDPIADMLTRIRNAGEAGHPAATMPRSKAKEAIAQVLCREGFLAGCEVLGNAPRQQLKLTLKYVNKKPLITGLRRVSSPGRRVYSGAKEIPRLRRGLGTVILTTPAGVLTDREARKQNIGGEILCYVW